MPEVTGPDLGEFVDAEQATELRAANQRLAKQLAQTKAKTADLIQATYQAAKDAAVIVGRPKLAAPPKDRRRGRAEVALWHLTDWQGGKRTVSYGLDVMDARVRAFCEKAAHITRIQRADHPVRECTIMFGGDMVEGVTIFPHQAWEVEASLFDQVFRVSATVEAAVRYALGVYEKVTVVAEEGNHGRLGRKGDSIKATDNMDRILYRIVADRFADEPRCVWEMPEGWYKPVTIGEYRAMLIHGDEVRGFGGNTPAYALARKGNAWASGAVNFDFTDIYVGHFHNANEYSLAAGGTIFMTGSTESDNEYAREFVAAASIPSQRLHFVDPERGRVSARYNVWLDK